MTIEDGDGVPRHVAHVEVGDDHHDGDAHQDEQRGSEDGRQDPAAGFEVNTTRPDVAAGFFVG